MRSCAKIYQLTQFLTGLGYDYYAKLNHRKLEQQYSCQTKHKRMYLRKILVHYLFYKKRNNDVQPQ